MDREKVRALLEEVARGALSPERAFARLRDLPVEDLGFARVDLHRALRHGAPEAVFCQGKTPAQVVAILTALAQAHDNILATRAEPDVLKSIADSGLPYRLHEEARVAVVKPVAEDGLGLVIVMSAGTADRPVAEEAAVVAEALGNRVERLHDCGVAGLVDRPVIAVPTSIGYGASFGGIAALLAMLNSCAPVISVVNIDNGYGAAVQASQINHLVAKVR